MAGGWRKGAAVHTRARRPRRGGRGLLSRPGWSHSGGSQSLHMSPEAESVRGGLGCGRFPVCLLGRCVRSACSAPALFQGALSRKTNKMRCLGLSGVAAEIDSGSSKQETKGDVTKAIPKALKWPGSWDTRLLGLRLQVPLCGLRVPGESICSPQICSVWPRCES